MEQRVHISKLDQRVDFYDSVVWPTSGFLTFAFLFGTAYFMHTGGFYN